MGLFSSIGKAINKVISPINKVTTGIFGERLGNALTNAALVAATIYSGGAAAGALGAAGATGTAALTSTAGLTAAGSAALAGYEQGAAIEQEKSQLAAEARAQKQQEEAYRESEITRKKALLAEQNSLSAKRNASRNVTNNIKAVSSGSLLGNESEKLGG